MGPLGKYTFIEKSYEREDDENNDIKKEEDEEDDTRPGEFTITRENACAYSRDSSDAPWPVHIQSQSTNSLSAR